MSEPFRRLKSFLAELRRRHVYRVAAVYAGVAFLLLEGVDLMAGPLGLPPVVMTVLVVVALFGFPLALVLAWALEMTPEGVRRTEPAPAPRGAGSDGEGTSTGGSAGGAGVLLGVGLLIAALAGWWLLPGDAADRAEIDLSAIRTVAVLPLDNFSGAPEQEPFVAGMHEELINQLSRVGALRVTSRTSVMRYRGDTLAIPEIGRQLGVDAVLEGSILKADDQVRITVQLIHVPTDTHLWSESFTRDLRDVLALHSEVARAVAQEVQAILTPEEERRLTRTREVEPEALEHYVRGRYLWNRRERATMEEALSEFRTALEIDPTYAEAWAGIADTYVVPAGSALADDAVARAIDAARHALALDSTLAEAHTALAYGLAIGDWAWEDAERHFRSAIDLNPSYATAHQWYAELLVATNRPDEAVASARRATVRDPLSGIIAWNLARILHLARRPRAALEQLEAMQRLGGASSRPGDPYIGVLSWLELERPDSAWATFLAFTEGIEAQAPPAARTSIRAQRDSLRALRDRGMSPVAAVGILLAAEREGASGAGDAPPESLGRLLRALVAVESGREDEALRLLERRVEQKRLHFTVVDLAAEPRLDPIRDDPRYRAMLEEVGLAGYWPEVGPAGGGP